MVNKFEQFLTPEILNFNLKFISIFIAVYENFKETLVNNVKFFYCNGFEKGKSTFPQYEKEVLEKAKSKENRQIKATLLWFKEHGAIDEADCKLFKKITDERNNLTHNMTNKLFEGLSTESVEIFVSMINLFEKLDKWWIREIEIPTSGEYTAEQSNEIAWDEISSVNLIFLKAMYDIAINGNEEYLKEAKAQFNQGGRTE